MTDQPPTWNTFTFYEGDIACGTADDLALSSDSVYIERARFYHTEACPKVAALSRGEDVVLRLEMTGQQGEEKKLQCIWVKLEPRSREDHPTAFTRTGDAVIVEHLQGRIVSKIGDAFVHELAKRGEVFWNPYLEQAQQRAVQLKRAAEILGSAAELAPFIDDIVEALDQDRSACRHHRKKLDPQAECAHCMKLVRAAVSLRNLEAAVR